MAQNTRRRQVTWSPEHILKLRKRLGWGKQELANRLGHKVEMISKLEAGEVSPDRNMISQFEHLSECINKHVENVSLSPHVDDHFQNNESEQIHNNDLRINQDH